MKCNRFLLTALCLSLAYFLPAQLAEWSFENISGNVPQEPIDPSFADPVIVGAGATSAGGSTTGSVDACSGAETWTTAFWPESGSRDPASFLSFVVEPEPGYGLAVSSFSFAANRTAQGPTQIDVYYSTDGFATEHYLLTGTIGDGPCTYFSANLTADIPAGGALEFRLYPYARAINARTASVRLDNVAIMGVAAPVELSRFTARRVGESVVLQWRTARESLNDYFCIERSIAGGPFTPIGRVAGAGSSEQPRSYRYTDRAPTALVGYYRLRQVDLDGFSTFYGPVAVAARPRGALRLFPSLARQHFSVHLPAGATNPIVEVLLFDGLGQVVRRWHEAAPAGSWTGGIADLPAGAYTVIVRQDHHFFSGRILKQ